MINIIFNGAGDFVLKAALYALNNDSLKEDFFGCGLNRKISSIIAIELSRYKSLRELVNSLIRIKLASPTASALLVNSENQIIPPLKCGAVSISASVSVWRNALTMLKNGASNIDSIVDECMALINHQCLTEKQKKVIECLGEGMNIEEIAEYLFLSVKTVYTYISHASTRYGFSTSKKLHRYILNENAGSVCRSIQIIPHLPLNDYVSLSWCV